MVQRKKKESENSGRKELSRRDFLKAGGAVIASAFLFNSLASCTSNTTNTTTTPTTTSTSATPPASTPASSTTTAATSVPKTLKIGMNTDLTSPLGLDASRAGQVVMDMVNKQGGLTVGTDRYNLELVVYDNKSDLPQSVAVVNKLIFEDKVKFIISDIALVDAWLPITEANKVILCAGSVTPAILDPNNHYAFNSGSLNPQNIVMSGWFFKNYPDKKTFVWALPDNQNGRASSAIIQKLFDTLGTDKKIDFEFYPATATELSALGTKINSLNPDVMAVNNGGPQLDGLAMRAAYEAGYRGQIFAVSTTPLAVVSQICPAGDLEGSIAAAWNTEFDPPPTQQAKDFKAAWIARYGNWESPEIMGTQNLTCLLTALQQAGSTDTDKVAAAIGSGLKWEGPTCPCQMVSRPDMGNSRTVDAVVAFHMKKIVNGKVTDLYQIPIDEAKGYFNSVFK